MDFNTKDSIIIIMSFSPRKLYNLFLRKWAISPVVIDITSKNYDDILKHIVIKYSTTHNILLIISTQIKHGEEYVGNVLAKKVADAFYKNIKNGFQTICLVNTQITYSVFNLSWHSEDSYIFTYKYSTNDLNESTSYCINHINVIYYFYNYIKKLKDPFCVKKFFKYIQLNSTINPILSRC